MAPLVAEQPQHVGGGGRGLERDERRQHYFIKRLVCSWTIYVGYKRYTNTSCFFLENVQITFMFKYTQILFHF